MPSLLFATGNQNKLFDAAAVAREYGVDLDGQHVDIDEIQSEDTVYIATAKAERAFEKLQIPLVVSDDSWAIPGLRGFPGPYMKSMNQWFTPENYLDLTRLLEDRRAILSQILVYKDRSTLKVFTHTTEGLLLKEIRGQKGVPFQKIAAFPEDGGLSIAEVLDREARHPGRSSSQVWHDLLTWYINR